MSQLNQEIVNTKSQVKSPSQRIWEVDFLRGFLLLFVVLDHFMFNLWYFCSTAQTGVFKWLYAVSLAYYDASTWLGYVQITTHNGFIMAFVFIAGISCNFTSSNLKRGVKLAVVAFLLSAITSAMAQVVHQPLEINFNVIHVLAVCCFVGYLLETLCKNCNAKQLVVCRVVQVVVAIALGIVGYYFHVNPIEDGGLLVVIVNCGNSVKFSPADYLPLLPALSFYIVGARVGAKIYSKKQSLLGDMPKLATLFCKMGQQSLLVYITSQAVMFGFFYLFTQLLPIL